MNLQNKLYYYFITIIFFTSCANNTTNDKFYNYIDSLNIKLNTKYIVISEDHCFSCNKSFYNLTQDCLNDTNIIFIITSEGGLLDTRIFENKKNVFFDDNKAIQKMGIINTSGFIKFDVNSLKIDTIIEIKPNNIEETIKIIKSP